MSPGVKTWVWSAVPSGWGPLRVGLRRPERARSSIPRRCRVDGLPRRQRTATGQGVVGVVRPPVTLAQSVVDEKFAPKRGPQWPYGLWGIPMMRRLARLRNAYWRMVVARYGEQSRTCRNVRSVLLCNGTLLAIGGVLISCMIFIAAPLPPVPPPTALERIGFGLLTLVVMSGGGWLAVYFARWPGSDDT